MSAEGCHCFDLVKDYQISCLFIFISIYPLTRLKDLALKMYGMKKLKKELVELDTQDQPYIIQWAMLSVLRILPERCKSDWEDHVNKSMYADNFTKNEATCYSPYYLLFGRSPHLLVDLLFYYAKEEKISISYPDYPDYAIQEAFSIANRNIQSKAAEAA